MSGPTIHDFADDAHSQPRSPTMLPTPAMAPESPVIQDHPSRDRQGSVASRGTRGSGSLDETGLRFRRVRRADTVTSYQQPAGEQQHTSQPGAEPGIDTAAQPETLPPHLSDLVANCEVNITDFSDTGFPQFSKTDNAGLDALLEKPRPDDMPCRWISVNGLSWDVIKSLGNKYHLHRLAIEDLIHTKTRTKVDWYADQAFVVLTLQKLVRLHQHDGESGKCDCDEPGNDMEANGSLDPEKGGSVRSTPSQKGWLHRIKHHAKKKKKQELLPSYYDSSKSDGYVSAHSGVSQETPIKPIRTLHRYESAQIPEHTAFMERHSVLSADDIAVSVEQVSLFLMADNTIISFFEHSAADVEGPIMDRLNSPETVLRRSCDASLLLQAIIDAIVDLAIPVKDAFNKARKELQIDAMTNPDIRTSRALHIFGEEIDMLQNLFKPIVHLVNALRDHQNEPMIPMAALQNAAHGGGTGGFDPDSPPEHQHMGHHSHSTQATGKPAKPLKRDREGILVLMRKLTDYRRKTPLNRSGTASSVVISPLAHTYFGDVLDHCITMIQAMVSLSTHTQAILLK
jgi:Mg2+ and Co2+ transporter CorA